MKEIQFFCVLKSSLMFCFNIPLPLYWEDCFNMFSQIKISCSWAYPLMLRTHFPLHVSNLVSNNSLLTFRVRAADPVADLGLGFQWDVSQQQWPCYAFYFFHEIYHLSSFSSILSPFRDMKPQSGRKSGRDVKFSLQFFFFFFFNVLWLHSLWQAGLTFNKQLLSTLFVKNNGHLRKVLDHEL